MKKTILFLAAIAAVAFTGCSSDDEIVHSNYPADNVVRVTAGVSEMATRAAYTTTTLGEFGLSISNPNNSKYSYNNTCVTQMPGTTTFTPAAQMLWENATQPVTVLAYAPYIDAYSSMPGNILGQTSLPFTLASDQTDAENLGSDFIVYKKENFVPGDNLNAQGAIPVSFKHLMSQLNITIKLGTELDQLADGGKLTSSPISDLKVNGTCLDADIDMTAAQPTVTSMTAGTGGEVRSVRPHEIPNSFIEASGTAGHEVSNATAKYSCILVPQTVNGFSISFTINDKNYVWTSPSAVNLLSGTSYTLELTVGKDIVVAGGMSVAPWDTNTTPTDLNTD